MVDSMGTGEICVANIGPKGRRMRLTFGIVQAGVGVVALLLMLALGAPLYWRFILLAIFWGAALGFFQWRDKT